MPIMPKELLSPPQNALVNHFILMGKCASPPVATTMRAITKYIDELRRTGDARIIQNCAAYGKVA